MSKRDYIRMEELLAAALRDLGGIKHEHAKLMTAGQIISLFQRDHYPIRKTDGGPDVHWNLQWKFIGDHRFKTSKHDVPQIAKAKRLTKAEHEFRTRMLAKTFGEIESKEQVRQRLGIKPKQKIPSRPFPKTQRKLRSK